MSRPANGWLRGTTIRKSTGAATSASHTRLSTPQVTSTSSTIFGGGVKDPSGRVSEYFSMDDQCPVCKSDRYLNPKLRLLVSACYHKMCESCIDRLFTLGPAPCPICTKVLRKMAFIPQTFEDLSVEQEVAVRRRMAKELTKQREDFADLRAYNDHLEWVENVTFNLINNIDVPETEKQIADFRKANAQLVQANIQRDEAHAKELKEAEEAERREREERAREAARQEEEERHAKDREREWLIDKLENSTKDASRIVARSRAAALKRTTRNNKDSKDVTATVGAKALLSRAAQSTVPDPPHVPMVDDWYAYADMFTLKPVYEDPVSELVRNDKTGIIHAGGYRVEEAWERAIRCAVAGLDTLPLGSELTETAPVAMDVS